MVRRAVLKAGEIREVREGGKVLVCARCCLPDFKLAQVFDKLESFADRSFIFVRDEPQVPTQVPMLRVQVIELGNVTVIDK